MRKANYEFSVMTKSFNTVEITVFRDKAIVFTNIVEPANIGFIKTMFLGVVFGMPKVQEALLKKAKLRCEQYIKTMRDNEVLLNHEWKAL